jgi:hypothetical protein
VKTEVNSRLLDVKIAVVTNRKFERKTLPILIPNLVENGIKSKQIHIFSGGYETYRRTNTDTGGEHYHQLDHNSYNYNGLIEIVDKEIKADYWFVIHDTCRVGPKFKQLLYNIPKSKPEKIALRINPSMSIGLYRYNYLMTVKERLLALKNKDYSEYSMLFWKDWGAKNEDYILWGTAPKPELYSQDETFYITAEENWYKTKTVRRTEYYPALDLYKSKSNWGQTSDKNNQFNIMQIDL